MNEWSGDYWGPDLVGKIPAPAETGAETMNASADRERDWLAEKLDDPEFLAGFIAEAAQMRLDEQRGCEHVAGLRHDCDGGFLTHEPERLGDDGIVFRFCPDCGVKL